MAFHNYPDNNQDPNINVDYWSADERYDFYSIGNKDPWVLWGLPCYSEWWRNSLFRLNDKLGNIAPLAELTTHLRLAARKLSLGGYVELSTAVQLCFWVLNASGNWELLVGNGQNHSNSQRPVPSTFRFSSFDKSRKSGTLKELLMTVAQNSKYTGNFSYGQTYESWESVSQGIIDSRGINRV